MNVAEVLALLREAPLIASVQASPGSPLADPETLSRLAKASLDQGVAMLRLEGVASIERVLRDFPAPAIGLIKREYPDSSVYITPTLREVEELLETPVEIVALDATRRPRPSGATLSDLVGRVHAAGRLAMGDCDDLASLHHAVVAGCDIVGTTLAGYTDTSRATQGPDFELLRQMVAESPVPVLAEGRYSSPIQVQTAMRIGAAGVVVGGALNDPVKQTKAFLAGARTPAGLTAAVDIGGTWLRFGLFDESWRLLQTERIELPASRDEREDWIRSRIETSGAVRLGVSSGGTIDPATGVVLEAKPIIPNHEGARLSDKEFGVPTTALNDGLASSWGHACLAAFAGRRVATLALGTGVGCGFVAGHRLWAGPNGEYPRLNDLGVLTDRSFEDLLGGAALSAEPSPGQIDAARYASIRAIRTIKAMWMPEAIVVCGGVGLAPWLKLDEIPEVTRSPFGSDAGLYGAAAIALWPPFDY